MPQQAVMPEGKKEEPWRLAVLGGLVLLGGNTRRRPAAPVGGALLTRRQE